MNSPTPLVSVIVPNYNYARYLPQRLDSILTQTFSDYELLLLDDASTDNSREMLEGYAEGRDNVQLVFNNVNTGSPFKQWERGVQLARGKYVWIAEADDYTEPTFLQTCVECLESVENAALCHVGCFLADSEGRVENRDPNNWGQRERKGFAVFDGPLYAEHNLYWKNYIINASGVVFNREMALTISPASYQAFPHAGDWFFWFQMALRGKVIEVYKRLNYFRQHSAKVTVEGHDKGRGHAEAIAITKQMENVLSQLSSYKRRLKRGRLYRSIKRSHYDKAVESELFSLLQKELNTTISDYRLERRNQWLRLFCPRLLTMKRDRL